MVAVDLTLSDSDEEALGHRDEKKKRREQEDADHALAMALQAEDELPPSPKRRRRNAEKSLLWRLSTVRGLSSHHNEGCVSIDDLLSGNFTHVLLMNYEVHLPWLLHVCPRLRRPDVRVDVVHGQRQPPSLPPGEPPLPNLRLYKPPLPPYGTHHSKMALLLFETGIRVCVVTANFVPGDWLLKSEGCWWQDFPLVAGKADGSICGGGGGSSSVSGSSSGRGRSNSGGGSSSGGGARGSWSSSGGSSSNGGGGSRSFGGGRSSDGSSAGGGSFGDGSSPGGGSSSAGGGRSKSGGDGKSGGFQNDFGPVLLSYLRSVGGIASQFARLLDGTYDFSAATAVLIPSTPGTFVGRDMDNYGHKRMAYVLSRCRPPTAMAPPMAVKPAAAAAAVARSTANSAGRSDADARLLMQFSSLSSTDQKWLDELVSSLLTGRRGPATSLEILFPTEQNVRDSLEGWAAGGSIPCAAKSVYHGGTDGDDFGRNHIKEHLRPHLRQWAGAARWGRHLAMPHIKTFMRYALLPDAAARAAAAGAADGGDKPPVAAAAAKGGGGAAGAASGAGAAAAVGRGDGGDADVDAAGGALVAVDWFLLTSSNFSKAAWGTMQKGASQLSLKSYEMGVLFLPDLLGPALCPPFCCTPGEAIAALPLAYGGLCAGHSDVDGEVPPLLPSVADTPAATATGPAAVTAAAGLPAAAALSAAAAGSSSAADCWSLRERGLPLDRLPVPYRLPPPRYGPRDRPWVWDVDHPEPDSHGYSFGSRG